MIQAQYFLQDLKLRHYLEVPPKPMFFAQSGTLTQTKRIQVATLWSAIVQIAVMNWVLGNIKGYPSINPYFPTTPPQPHYFQYLHTRSTRLIHLPRWKRLLHRKRNMGCHRPPQDFYTLLFCGISSSVLSCQSLRILLRGGGRKVLRSKFNYQARQ
jgi:hypothetical protein